jgi:hypothetical protein
VTESIGRPVVRRGALFSLGLVAMLSGIGAVAPSLAPAARAQQSRSCVNDPDYGYSLGMEITPPKGAAQDNDARGTRPDIYIPTVNAECQRIESVYGTGVLGQSSPGHQPGRAGADGHSMDAFDHLKPKLGEPCVGPARTTLTVLAARTPAPMWLPAPRSAPALDGAWTCGGITPFLTFGDIRISYEAGWADVDPKTNWNDLAAAAGGQVHTILGRSALVQPAVTTDGNNQVLIVVGDTLIRVASPSTVPMDRLVGLALSLRITQPVNTALDADSYLTAQGK